MSTANIGTPYQRLSPNKSRNSQAIIPPMAASIMKNGIVRIGCDVMTPNVES